MRPADECNALARDVRAQCEVRERSERVEAPPCRRDRALAVADRADLARAARAETVGKQHGVAVAQPRIGTQREALGELAFAAGARRIHAGAAVQRDDCRESAGRRRARRQQHESAQRHRSRRNVVERGKCHRLDAPRVRMRRHGGQQQRDEQPLQSSSRNRRSSRHAASFSAIGRVYAGLVEGSTSVA